MDKRAALFFVTVALIPYNKFMSDVLIQVVGAFLFALAMVWDKYNLRKYQFAPETYTSMMFICLTAFAGVVSAVTFNVQWGAVGVGRWVAFAGVVGLAFLWNKLYYYFQKREELQDFEVMNLVVPAVTALLAGLVFSEERQVITLAAVSVALFTLFIARIEMHHTKFNAYSKLIIVMIMAMAAEAVLRKVVLEVMDPATLYFLRTLLVTGLLLIFYRPASLPRSVAKWGAALGPAVIGGSAMILMFYGYSHIGLVMTTLVFALSPMIVYYLDALVLHERIHPKNIYATVIIIAAIVVAGVYG